MTTLELICNSMFFSCDLFHLLTGESSHLPCQLNQHNLHFLLSFLYHTSACLWDSEPDFFFFPQACQLFLIKHIIYFYKNLPLHPLTLSVIIMLYLH